MNVLILAAAALPMVPPAYRPLASAVLDELKAYRKKATEQADHIDRLTMVVKGLQEHCLKLTEASNSAHQRITNLAASDSADQRIKNLVDNIAKTSPVAH